MIDQVWSATNSCPGSGQGVMDSGLNIIAAGIAFAAWTARTRAGSGLCSLLFHTSYSRINVVEKQNLIHDSCYLIHEIEIFIHCKALLIIHCFICIRGFCIELQFGFSRLVVCRITDLQKSTQGVPNIKRTFIV